MTPPDRLDAATYKVAVLVADRQPGYRLVPRPGQPPAVEENCGHGHRHLITPDGTRYNGGDPRCGLGGDGDQT